MAERPIPFTARQVRAALDGTMTQTRRLVKPQPEDHHWQYAPALASRYEHRVRLMETSDGPRWRFSHALDGREDQISTEWKRCPYGQPGDLLWVRETFGWVTNTNGLEWLHDRPHIHSEDFPADDGHYADALIYRADGEIEWTDDDGSVIYNKRGEERSLWQPSIHMPKWAARLWLEVVEVRCERLQDISEEDAKAEGLLAQEGDGGAPGAGYKWTGTGYNGGSFNANGPMFHAPAADGLCACKAGGRLPPAVCAFRELWNRINGKRSPWESNPWVWALTFRRTEAPQKEAA